MRKQAELLQWASELTSDTGHREGTWRKYDEYTMAIAARDGARYIKTPSRYRDGAKVGMGEYRPLAKYPDLFLRFGRLLDDRSLDFEKPESKQNERAALEWVREYGVLGLTFPEASSELWGCDPRGGRGDTVRAFVEEAWVANAVLRLYEAATHPDSVDVDTIAPYVPPRHRGFYTSTPEIAAAWALEQATVNVNHRLGRHTCLQLYSSSARDRFLDGHDFRSLLGAMYLQAMWLLIADKPGRCRNPKCGHILTFEQPEQRPDPNIVNDRSMGYRTRSDREYCSKRCADAHNYQTVKKPLRDARRARRRAAPRDPG